VWNFLETAGKSMDHLLNDIKQTKIGIGTIVDYNTRTGKESGTEV
jgi:hypothetical protein